MNIAIFASGSGSNFEAIAKAIKRGNIKGQIVLLITDKEKAFARIRAKRLGIRDLYINPQDYQTRLDFDKAVIGILRKEKIELVALAGFMRIITPYFVRQYKYKIMNIHPAILPAFRGEHAIERAFAYGSKITGVTVHFVDEKIDHGPVILQEIVAIKKGMSLKQLTTAVHRLEHILYPRAIKLFTEKRLKIKGRHVKVC